MKFLRNYDIDVIRLREGAHEFSFDVNDEFFSQFEDNNLVTNGNLTVKVVLNKDVNLIEALFDIDGTVELVCDRSLETFDYPLHAAEKVLYKYGAEEQEINEDIFIITRDTPRLKLAQLIYEFILLALPAKKIHPDYIGEMDDEDFDDEGQLVYVSDEDGNEDEDIRSADEDADPRWDILKSLKNKD